MRQSWCTSDIFFQLSKILQQETAWSWYCNTGEFVERGRSQTTLTRFCLVLTTYSPALTISMVWTLTNSGHFWTTYLPRLVNVDCERPPKLTSKQPYRVTWMTVCRYEGEGKGTGYTLLQQCDLWKLWGLGRTATITKFQNFDATSCYCKMGWNCLWISIFISTRYFCSFWISYREYFKKILFT